VAASVGDAEIEVGGFGQVAIGAEVPTTLTSRHGLAWNKSSESPRSNSALPSRNQFLGAGENGTEKPASSDAVLAAD